jgi:hypothetical protein
MNGLSIKRFGVSCGVASALLYTGCVLVMASLGEEGTIRFFNSLLHGIDVTTIIRMEIPVSEMLMGIVQIFILGWLTGAVIAAVYNVGLERGRS